MKVKTVMKKIFLAVWLAFGMALPACEPTGEPLLLAEDADLEIPGKTLMAGSVIRVRQKTGNPRISLSVRETRTGKNGHPLCDAPTGRLLHVESVTEVVSKPSNRLKSAFVVMGNPTDPPMAKIERGMCITVSPDTRGSREKLPGTKIAIVAAPGPGKSDDRVGAGIVTIWPGPPLQEKTSGRNRRKRHDSRPLRERNPRRAA